MSDMDYTAKRVTVMGLGRFGGGVGVTRYLCAQGADVRVTDALPSDKLQSSLHQIQDLIDTGQVTLRLGEHNVSDFTTADLVVVNPAVDPRDNRFLRAAQAAGVALTSEIRLLVAALPNRERVIGVTGSAGKSTVTAMIGCALNAGAQPPDAAGAASSSAPSVHVGGNLGGSLLGVLDRIGPNDWVVLELSSFMLEGLDEDDWSPHIAVVTSLAPNHLDRHGTFEQYVAAKQTILEHQAPTDRCVLGPGVAQHMRPMAPQVFLSADVNINLTIPGEHNRTNARLAATACGLTGISPQAAADRLRDFPGLPHRLQFVGEFGGIRCYNDSKSTTPDAARLALESFPGGPSQDRMVHVILGGYDKGSDLTDLARFAAEHCRAIYAIGATGPDIAAAAQSVSPATCDVVLCDTLVEAVARASGQLRRGDILLLSPGCASWDQFNNYEQRGQAFIELVQSADFTDGAD